jgi:type IV secretory pathway VirB2 component (pilin)
MSINSLSSLAVQREAIVPRKAKKKAGADEAETVPQTWTDVIVSAIPSEPLALYTTIIGIIIATITVAGDNRFWLRWILYVVGIVAVVIWLSAEYYRKRTVKKRHFPIVEAAAASIAFAGWGLVMPGNPLALSLSKDNRIIWTALITAATVFLLGLLGIPLKDKAK